MMSPESCTDPRVAALVAAQQPWLHIGIDSQTLTLFRGAQPLATYPVSTARNGAGQAFGSECTPTGWHSVRALIGADAPLGAVFRGRRPTGEVWSPALHQAFPGRDWILTRILWLSGLEPGHNRGGRVDSMRRYIYIHGTPDSEPMGLPLSHGCVRMRNSDIAQLFDQVGAYTPVLIEALS
ncbi:MAG: L,D-transpeptidase [Moraxellaceae bacterium]|nr:L,D-transpeptidase [Moraxellaceae bacterium]